VSKSTLYRHLARMRPSNPSKAVCDWWDRLKQNEATLFCDWVRQDSRPSRLTLICLIPIFAGTQCMSCSSVYQYEALERFGFSENS
jgi:hypothetical protein